MAGSTLRSVVIWVDRLGFGSAVVSMASANIKNWEARLQRKEAAAAAAEAEANGGSDDQVPGRQAGVVQCSACRLGSIRTMGI